MAWNCHQIHEKREFLLGGNSYQVHFSLGHNLVTTLSRLGTGTNQIGGQPCPGRQKKGVFKDCRTGWDLKPLGCPGWGPTWFCFWNPLFALEVVMLELPLPFKPTLDKKPALSALVTTGFSQFKPVLKYNHQLFFEDYTDHGQPHIQRVLEAAAFLVTPETLPLLSPEDIAVLSLACLFHGLAMQFAV